MVGDYRRNATIQHGGVDELCGHNNSLYVMDALNADPTVIDSYVQMNAAAATFPDNEMMWVNISDYVAIPDYTVDTAGTYSFSIIGREDGFLVDGFAFVTKDQTVTFGQLDTALAVVPEPATLGHLGFYAVEGGYTDKVLRVV